METTVTVLATVCATGVAGIALHRWRQATKFGVIVYLAVAVCAGFVALLNLVLIAADDSSFVQTVSLAYAGFATVIMLPVARALSRLTYDAPEATSKDDRTI